VSSLATSSENQPDDDEVDDKESVRNSALIVRLPVQAPNAQLSSFIVIDDSDGELETPSDVKPDRQQLDEIVAPVVNGVSSADHIPRTTTTTTVTTEQTNLVELQHSASVCPPHEPCHQMSRRQSADGAGPSTTQASSRRHVGKAKRDSNLSSRSESHLSQESTPSAAYTQSPGAADHKSPGRQFRQVDRHLQPGTVRQNVGVQTAHVDNSAERQLESLRSNVLQLLKTIIPSLTCNNLEFVDEIVVEMVRVNAENSDVDSQEL